jgi:hypothetical protein
MIELLIPPEVIASTDARSKSIAETGRPITCRYIAALNVRVHASGRERKTVGGRQLAPFLFKRPSV